jgi:hypothetical protein
VDKGPSCVSPTPQLKREPSLVARSTEIYATFQRDIRDDISEIAVDTVIAVNGFFD